MKVFLDHTYQVDNHKKVAIALGTFDGMHLGHQELIQKLQRVSHAYHCSSMVFTFQNHPLGVINKDHQPDLLMTKGEKILALNQFPLDYLAMVPFTQSFATLHYSDFINKLLSRIPIEHLVVGYNFSFGAGGEGKVDHLITMSREMGFMVHVMPPFALEGEIISSTKVRKYLCEGQIKSANRLLGKPYSIVGKIVHGKKIGRTLDSPTANIAISELKAIPKCGVYLTVARLGSKLYPSVTNIGVNPTISLHNAVTIETHLLNFNMIIYELPIKLFFVDRIRDEIRFASREQLAQQIKMDISIANKFFCI